MTAEEPPTPSDAANQRRAIPLWTKWFVGFSAAFVAVGIAGTVIRLPYDTLSPGSARNVAPLVSVKGARAYRGAGDVMLLFVRERDHINVWSWLQAKLDSNIDLLDQKQLTGGIPQKHPNEQGACDMTQSKISARVAALSALGYKVKLLPHVDVVGFPRGEDKKKRTVTFPAEDALVPCDEITAVDGHAIKHPDDAGRLIGKHRAGTAVSLSVVRSGHPMVVKVRVVQFEGKRIIGISAAPRFDVPVTIKIDTRDITGPSAGLAMTLAIIDHLTPGDLTGGKRVAVTGTISPAGAVGQIGGIDQKAVSVKSARAQIFIVPACGTDAGCAMELKRLKQRLGKNVAVKPVATLAQALRVLRDAGGAPLPAKAGA